jgi:hypothetical protein
MNRDAKRGLLESGPSSKDSAAGGKSAATVAQVQRRREAPDPEPAVDTDALTELWANAKTAWIQRDFPKYGSPAWCALGPDDPRRLAGALEAAEMWRKYGDEEALLQWFREANRSRPPYADGLSRAELDAHAKPQPAHQLQATPGWPPIRIPGQPGRYLKHTEGRAAA